MRWNLTGTENQQRIMREGFGYLHFPFDRLTQLPGTPELGWRDLNSGHYAELARSLGFEPGEDARVEPDLVHRHGDNHHDGDRPDPLHGVIDGKRWVMGIIYTQSGRIYIDVDCESRPELAWAVLGAEIAHAVDFFLPMTDAQRNELLRLWAKPNTTWWEVFDYGSEYYRLGGEAFMHEFVAAYSDLDFGDKSSFLHDAGVEPADVRRILGIERTDASPAAPEPAPEPPAPLPVPEPTPEPEAPPAAPETPPAPKPPKKPKPPKGRRPVFKSAINGRFVSSEYAEAHQDTTYATKLRKKK